MIRAALIMAVGAGVLGFLGIRDWAHAAEAKAEPDKLTAAELIERGPNGNPYVEIREFDLADDFIYEEKNGVWQRAWCPAVAAKQKFARDKPMPKSTVKLIFKYPKAKNENDVAALADQETVRGMVINQIDSLGSKEKKLLSEKYGEANWDQIVIFEVERDPSSSRTKGMILTFLGVGLLIAAVVVFVIWLARRPPPEVLPVD
jgi:hypothetical protein